MPPLTPQITLLADLRSILDEDNVNGFLEITLCGFGPVVPRIPGTCLIADAGIPMRVGPYAGTPLSVMLWGNDVIIPGPDTTFYCISVLDANQNVIQSGNYRFDGTETIDFSGADQIIPPYGFLLKGLIVAPCAGAVPGTIYTAPGKVIGAFYNGTLMRPGVDYTALGAVITLTFTTEIKPDGQPDDISALCVVN